jgi:septal ring factor EnvC (AmiA/AmiB activator)
MTADLDGLSAEIERLHRELAAERQVSDQRAGNIATLEAELEAERTISNQRAHDRETLAIDYNVQAAEIVDLKAQIGDMEREHAEVVQARDRYYEELTALKRRGQQ